MQCPRCQGENPPESKFCLECGARLVLICAKCGTELPAGGKFCPECGEPVNARSSRQSRFTSPEAYTPKHLAEKILTSRSALEGERKQVTVLFCDLANSTALAERLGPEAMHALLNRFFELALAEVHRYEGTINQFLGDGFMALFGAPLAYEDHARRAMLASLGIRRALAERYAELSHPHGLELSTRMGLNTGLVVVGKIGDSLRMDYTAVGDTTNVAARLQQLAEPGTILASESTRRLAHDYVRLEAMGPVHVKGKTEPIIAYKVLGLRARRSPLERLGERPLTRFVGRKRELAALYNLLAHVERGQGQAAGIMGEPGMGKSRLLLEFRRGLRERRVTYLEGRCLSHGSAIPYLPLLDILRNNCGIAETDTRETISEKIRFGLEEWGMDPDEAGPYLLHLLGVKDGTDRLALLSPEVIKARTFETFRQLSLKGSQRQPIIFVVEDLQWIDKTSEEFFASLVESIPGAPILFLSTYRPGYRPPWIEKSYATQIALRPLSPRDSLTMVQSVLETVSDPLARAILGKAEGNPFFLEELARSVGEQRDVRPVVTIPDTIQGVLMARIDRLPDDSKRLLQTASVLGREFTLRLLRAIWEGPGAFDPHLRELTRLEFLYEQTGTEEPVYVFKHALTQEVVYAGLLERRRRAYHGAVGFALEEQYAARTDEVVELLAHHFGQSEEGEKAVDYAIIAAEKAQRRWANTEALAHFDAALKRLEGMPDTEPNRLRRIDAVLKQAEVKLALGQHVEHIKALEGIRNLVEGVADPRRRAAWYYWTGFLHSLTGSRPEVVIAYCREALAIADAGGFEDIKAFAESCLAQVYGMAGKLQAAVVAGEHALESFEVRGNIWWACRTLWILSTVANALGEWERGLEYCRRALEHGQAVNDLRLKVVGLWRTGSTHIHRGDSQAGLRCCEQALALSPIPLDAAMIRATRGYGLVKAGQAEVGTAELAEAVAWFDRSHLRYTWSFFALRLGEAYLRQGEWSRARQGLEEVLATSREVGYRRLEGVAHRLLGESLAPEDPATAADHLETATRILEEVGARNEFAKALVAQAGLRRTAGDTAGARQLIERALAIFEALGTLDELPHVRTALTVLEKDARA